MPATQQTHSAHVVGLVPVITLVLWAGCLLVGAIGFALPYALPHPPAPSPAPVTVPKISVELASSPPVSFPGHQTPARLASPPPAPPVAYTAPSPALAFTLPISAPAQIVGTSSASFSLKTTPAPNAPAQTLVLSQGEGRQTLPTYPPDARRKEQEGIVVLHIDVDAAGRVTNVEITSASPWPLLNAAAVRTVREHWHFSPGVARDYNVSVPFRLTK